MQTYKLNQKNKKRFIPSQVACLERCASVLCALQMQKNKIRMYSDLIAAVDNGDIKDTVYREVVYRDLLVGQHDRHVGIYRYILDYYASFITNMTAQTIAHMSGAPCEHAVIPFVHDLKSA